MHLQEMQKAVRAERIAWGDEDAKRMMLNVRAVEQHSRLPVRTCASFNKQYRTFPPAFFKGDGKGNVRRSESDTDQVIRFAAKCWHLFTRWYRMQVWSSCCSRVSAARTGAGLLTLPQLCPSPVVIASARTT